MLLLPYFYLHVCSVHRVFIILVLLRITSLHLSFGLPIFRRPSTFSLLQLPSLHHVLTISVSHQVLHILWSCASPSHIFVHHSTSVLVLSFLVTTSSSVFLSTCSNHLSIASLIFSLMSHLTLLLLLRFSFSHLCHA